MPPPEADLAPHHRRGAGEAEGPLEEDLGLVVAVEDRGMLHPPHLRCDERLGDGPRGVAVVAEVDGGLGEDAREPVQDDEDRERGDGDADRDEDPVGTSEADHLSPRA